LSFPLPPYIVDYLFFPSLGVVDLYPMYNSGPYTYVIQPFRVTLLRILISFPFFLFEGTIFFSSAMVFFSFEKQVRPFPTNGLEYSLSCLLFFSLPFSARRTPRFCETLGSGLVILPPRAKLDVSSSRVFSFPSSDGEGRMVFFLDLQRTLSRGCAPPFHNKSQFPFFFTRDGLSLFFQVRHGSFPPVSRECLVKESPPFFCPCPVLFCIPFLPPFQCEFSPIRTFPLFSFFTVYLLINLATGLFPFLPPF